MDTAKSSAGRGGGQRLTRKLAIIAINIASLVCLVWVLRGSGLSQLNREVAHLHWPWVAVSAVSGVLVYLWQAWRWSLLLAPVKPVSVGHSTRAIFVGLFANELLPLRAGEIVRCFLQGRWSQIPLSVVLASALIERIFDGVWLMACLFAAFRSMPRMPRFLVDGAYVLGAVILVVAAFLAIAMYWREQTLDALVKAKWLSWVHILVQDLHLIGHSRYLYMAFLVSMPYLLMQVLPIYALFQAYAPLAYLGWLPAFVTMVILRLGAVVPQAPGSLGAFNALTVVSLLLFHVPRALAKRFSILLWVVVTIPLLLTGFIALAITGVKMDELRRHAEAATSAPREPAPVAPHQ